MRSRAGCACELCCYRREAGLLDKLKTLAARRRLDDLTIGPVLTWTTEAMIAHAEKLAALPGAKILFGAKELCTWCEGA